MKKFIYSFILILFSTMLFSANITRKTFKLKGEIKKWVSEYFSTDEGRKKIFTEITIFNADGTIREKEKYLENKFLFKEIYTYENNKLISYEKYNKPNVLSLKEKYTYINNHLFKTFHYSQNRLTHITSYIYEKSGKKITSIKKTNKGFVTLKTLTEYDNNDNEILRIVYTNRNHELYRIEKKYQNKKIISTAQYRFRKLQSRTNYEYQNDNRLTELSFDNNNVLIKKLISQYRNNQLIREDLWYRGKYEGFTIYKYDNNGQLIERLTTTPQNKLFMRLILRYDGKGNIKTLERFCPLCQNKPKHTYIVNSYEYF